MSIVAKSAIAIIPARGGSKGIPNKNLQTVGGVTLLARTISACLKSESIATVYVSTDSDDIAAVALNNGAQVIRRPADISGDTASSESALLHSLNEIEKTSSLPKNVLFAQCTSPFITHTDIDGILDLLKDHDSALTVTHNHAFIWRKDNTGNAIGINHDSAIRLPRQQLDPEYKETGALYAMNIDQFRKCGHRFFGRIGMYEVPADRSMEIDEPEDLRLANTLEIQEKSMPSRQSLQAIKAVVFDFDGVMTDDQVYITETGEEMVMASRSDGMGISALKNAGLKLLILSKERNPVVARRAEKLQIEVIQACDNKLEALTEWLSKNQLPLSQCAYVGNDINDLQCMQAVKLAIAPIDAHPLATQAAHWRLTRAGGKGAIRELSDAIINC
jgi:YrbI family 3-deoxy-D-manno-octulosonate 8-phosphate phosphatase